MASDLFIFPHFFGGVAFDVIPYNTKNHQKKKEKTYKNNKNEILLFIGCVSNSSMENQFI